MVADVFNLAPILARCHSQTLSRDNHTGCFPCLRSDGMENEVRSRSTGAEARSLDENRLS